MQSCMYWFIIAYDMRTKKQSQKSYTLTIISHKDQKETLHLYHEDMVLDTLCEDAFLPKW